MLRSQILQAAAAILWAAAAHASVHVVDGPAVGWKATERMFHSSGASNNSWVHVNFSAVPIAAELDPASEYAVAVAIYTTTDDTELPDDYCSQDYSAVDARNMTGHLFLPASAGSAAVNGTDAFVVETTGLQTVVIVTCARPKRNGSEPALPFEENPNSAAFDLRASIAFKNPYGYLPGLMWGLLPFSASLFIAYLVADGIFITLLVRNRHTLIRLHFFILLVLLLTTLETVLWFLTYSSLNETGQALCCPYPKMIVASTMMKVFSKLIARVLTMIICLGYGIARPKLTCAEGMLVAGLGLCYVVSTGALEITHLSNQSVGDVSPPLVWELLATATDGCFAGWIFTSLMLTRKTLRATGQSAKYKMYDLLFSVLVTFMAVTFLFTCFENAVYSKRIELGWEWMWVLWASSRSLNFGIVFVVSIIWRPTRTSLLYSHSVQVPSSDADWDKPVTGREVELVVVEESEAGPSPEPATDQVSV